MSFNILREWRRRRRRREQRRKMIKDKRKKRFRYQEKNVKIISAPSVGCVQITVLSRVRLRRRPVSTCEPRRGRDGNLWYIIYSILSACAKLRRSERRKTSKASGVNSRVEIIPSWLARQSRHSKQELNGATMLFKHPWYQSLNSKLYAKALEVFVFAGCAADDRNTKRTMANTKVNNNERLIDK